VDLGQGRRLTANRDQLNPRTRRQTWLTVALRGLLRLSTKYAQSGDLSTTELTGLCDIGHRFEADLLKLAVSPIRVFDGSLPRVRACEDGDLSPSVVIEFRYPPVAREFPLLEDLGGLSHGGGGTALAAGPSYLDHLVPDLAMIPAQKSRDLV
jgi:hypothetical protein